MNLAVQREGKRRATTTVADHFSCSATLETQQIVCRATYPTTSLAKKLGTGFRTKRRTCQAKLFSFICKFLVGLGFRGIQTQSAGTKVQYFLLAEAEELGFGDGADAADGLEYGGGDVTVEAHQGDGFGSNVGFAAT